MFGLDHMAVGMGVDVTAGVESHKYTPRSNGSARRAVLGTGVESYGLQTLCDTADAPLTSIQEEIAVLEKTLATTSLFWLARVLEKELEKHQKKLNGPKKTAKHIGAKRDGVGGKSKRIETESAKLAEMQENLRVRREILRVAYEEIKILREDLSRKGESIDKNKSHNMSQENTEELRILEQQELAFWRGSASKRLAGWIRDGSTEEFASWRLEAQTLNKEVEAKKRKLQEAIEMKTVKDARMGDDSMDGLDGSEWKRLVDGEIRDCRILWQTPCL